jgi:hypothetical protein
LSGGDAPLPGDHGGNGKTDIAMGRRSGARLTKRGSKGANLVQDQGPQGHGPLLAHDLAAIFLTPTH